MRLLLYLLCIDFNYTNNRNGHSLPFAWAEDHILKIASKGTNKTWPCSAKSFRLHKFVLEVPTWRSEMFRIEY